MKKTDLKTFIKEEIISILSEEEGKISPEDVKNAEEYKGHLEDISKLQSKMQKEELDDESSKFYFDYLNDLRDSGRTNMFGVVPYLQAEFGLDKNTARQLLAKWMKSKMNEDIDDDDDDKDAVKGAMGARGKFKKLDLAVKNLDELKKQMMSLAKEYGKNSTSEERKEEIKDILRKKTPMKRELESLISRLEKDAI